MTRLKIVQAAWVAPAVEFRQGIFMFRRSAVSIPVPLLEERCRALDCAVPVAALPPLAAYLETLMRWNAVMNLVGAHTWQDALRVLVADSFHLAFFLESLNLPSHPQVWDLGAGAGLPGLPLRMVWEKGRYVLVEAREKRALFLVQALALLRLPRTEVFHGRAEDFFKSAEPPAQLVISRAFMPWPEVLKLVADRMAPDGRVVFLASAPPPARLAVQWMVEAERRYMAGDGARWFWSLRRSD